MTVTKGGDNFKGFEGFFWAFGGFFGAFSGSKKGKAAGGDPLLFVRDRTRNLVAVMGTKKLLGDVLRLLRS